MPEYRGISLIRPPPPPRTLQQAYALGPMVVLGGGLVFKGEVPLYSVSLGETPVPAAPPPLSWGRAFGGGSLYRLRIVLGGDTHHLSWGGGLMVRSLA